MMTFVGACLSGQVDPLDIHDWIYQWHTCRLDQSLTEFLGLTATEYVQFMYRNIAIIEIIERRKIHTPEGK